MRRLRVPASLVSKAFSCDDRTYIYPVLVKVPLSLFLEQFRFHDFLN